MKRQERSLKLGEALAGYVLVKSPYLLSYGVANQEAVLCEMALSSQDVNNFIEAIKRRFVYELLVDELPIKLFVGESIDNPSKVSLYTHVAFDIHVNDGFIVQATASHLGSVELHKDQKTKLRFTYSVAWTNVRITPFLRLQSKASAHVLTLFTLSIMCP